MIGIGVHRFQRLEIFPFSSWSMYSQVPSTLTDFRILVYELDGEPVEPPAFLRDIPGNGTILRSTVNSELLRRFGWAVIQKRPETGDLQRAIEKSFGLHHSDYALIQVIYDPLEFYWEGSFRQSLIRRYRSASPLPATESMPPQKAEGNGE